MTRSLAWLFAIAAFVATSGPASAQAESPFFLGKTIRFVLFAAAGQGYDSWARMMARHLPRHIPGTPSIVVENMPGAGGIIATNWLYNRAERDGTVWGMVNHNVADQALSKMPNVEYDPSKLIFLGTPELTTRACFAISSAKVKKAEDLFTTDLLVGGTGAGSPVTQTPKLLRNLFGMRFKLVEGYKSPQDAILAMERGELEGLCQTIQSFEAARPGWISTGKAKILFVFEQHRTPDVDAPSIFEFAKTPEDRMVLRYYSASGELGRPFALPPGVPAERVQMLRRAFDATMQDEAFLAEAEKLGYRVTARTGEQLQAIILDEMATSPEVIARTSKLTSGK